MPGRAVRNSLTRRLAAVALAALAWLGMTAAMRAQEPGEAKAKGPTNRLAAETSPYLRMHARNPVDWYPWGPEAFARAKAENKPIFLSVGYSACYWCHVMERESFRDPEIARFLNEHFVCVKVDREERPDVDQVYMVALQAFTSGGWPMSMFLLPDGRPFYGETYMPPRDRDGGAGFLTVIKGIDRSFRAERGEIDRAANGLAEIVRRKLGASGSRRRPPLSRAMAAEGRRQLAAEFDPEYGGFGYNPQNARRPKFPEPANLVFLLEEHRRDGRQPARKGAGPGAGAAADPLPMVLLTLDRMARGGIRDQVGGGYHRYAISRYWIVPHFEKMLYDNAQLASVHVAAFEATGDPRWRAEAEATLAFVARSLTAPEGGFYSSLDAETEAGEGAYYVWSRDEAARVLGDAPAAEAFLQVYGLKRPPNFEGDRYVLLQPRPLEEQARKLGLEPADLERRLRPLAARLLEARERRPAPSRDDKVLTAWNGLMIAAYADASRALGVDRYGDAAAKAADFLLGKLRSPDGRLLRSYCEGRATLPGYLEDYAFLIHGLLRLHAATGQARWLDEARALADRMIADFSDPAAGGFFFTASDHESLLARPKDPYDGAIPGGNSMAALDLLALHRIGGEERYHAAARRTVEAFATTLSQDPSSMPLMLVALQQLLDRLPEPSPAGPEPVAAAAKPASAGVVAAAARVLDGEKPAAGGSFRAVVSLSIKPGWHITANPPGMENLVPAVLSVADGQPARLDPAYPPGTDWQPGQADGEKARVYEGRVEIPVRVRLDGAGMPPRLALKLRYQPCDEKACLPPATVDIPLDLTPVTKP
ncbi:DUF255 domain-containing protein [Aquisphaera giovannonii]|uniref:DUF255 domain-containing protein n=1 Tax=Aquisphaera giovannonii TaxID=406548 RepID=UPI001FEC6ED0|nr:DUF255 domain-containing protein [Aquisphaera giovannonii]